MLKIIKILGILLGLLVLGVGGFLAYLTIMDYTPNEKETVFVDKQQKIDEFSGDKLSIMSWNLGYGGLDETQDFFMDGGETVLNDSEDRVKENVNAIGNIIKNNDIDVYLFQEVDINSKRSYGINEYQEIKNIKKDYDSTFAYNYKVSYVPYPWPMMGHVESGLASLSRYNISSSTRYQFPGNYSWPKKLGFLDRCFVENKISISGSDKEIVIINTHNSAYDSDGSLRKQQLEYLKNYLKELYENGDYIIVGGDWNHILPGIKSNEFETENEAPKWVQYMDENWKLEGWNWGKSNNAPTVRGLNQSFKKGKNFTTVIDGFLVSPNIEIESAKNLDLNFVNSDHNPVIISVNLKN